MLSLLPITPDTYAHHWLHDDDRDWPETNCYVDLWVEVLHALGLDPLACLAFTLESGYDGEQWEFFKPLADDLRELYGVAVREINVWRALPEHIAIQLQLGNLLTIEVDSFYLPDTEGVSYGIGHQKTTIAPQMIDHDHERLGYFHNRGYHELCDADYRAVMRVDAPAEMLPPYAELVDLAKVVRRPDTEVRALVDGHVRRSLSRRPEENPVARLVEHVERDLPWLRANPEQFHLYAFGTLRQVGAWAATTASFVRWLDRAELTPAVEALEVLSATSKTCQFKMARVLSGRDVDLSELFARMPAAWATAIDLLVSAYGV